MSEIDDSGWRNKLIEDSEGVRQVLAATKRVAVLGIRSEQRRSRPAFYVPQYLASAGLQVIPVPVYELQLDESGIKVVQDRCLMVEHRRHCAHR